MIEITVADHLVGELDARWPPIALDPDGGTGGPVTATVALGDEGLFLPGSKALGFAPGPEAWDLLEQTLTLFAIRRLARQVAVHAAAICWQGSVVLVPAHSGEGKSTLALAAAQAGAAVLSDEYALVDRDTALVVGWHRPVRLRLADGTTERRDLAVRAAPAPVRLVAHLRHDPQVGDRWRSTTAGETALQLLQHTVPVEGRPEVAFQAAVALARSALGVEGTRGEAAESLAALGTLLAKLSRRDGPAVS